MCCKLTQFLKCKAGGSIENNRIQSVTPLAMDCVYPFSELKSSEFTLIFTNASVLLHLRGHCQPRSSTITRVQIGYGGVCSAVV